MQKTRLPGRDICRGFSELLEYRSYEKAWKILVNNKGERIKLLRAFEVQTGIAVGHATHSCLGEVNEKGERDFS
ncbi:MAG: hypothetical protein JXR70_16775 [Spirochaetales bacterium]|nr:hypothetical protein [Spirochaetales bacterium]